MLVLSRTRGEQIVIDGNITVTVLEVRGDKVRLGFDGPAEVPIHRQEVFQRLEQDRQNWDPSVQTAQLACTG
ncbi:MAG TPA: carbon storage regulator CsrA [Pirellulales bacterium]|nr:carbon storage regulator CsrA [Pirellulales bacterium]